MPGEATSSTAPVEIHRLKARLVFKNGDVKMVQGVREVFEIFDAEQSSLQNDGPPQAGKIVLIGRGAQELNFERSLLDALQNRQKS